MSLFKVLIGSICVLGVTVAVVKWLQHDKPIQQEEVVTITPPAEEIVIASVQEEPIVITEELLSPAKDVEVIEAVAASGIASISSDDDLPADVDRMNQLFQPYPPLLPIVETLSYVSRVSWVSGRSAYLGDYASYYQTPKHFISRSLKGVGNYLSEKVSKNDRFNVYRKDKEIEFHLVLDLSRLKMWVYYFDATDNERVLLKTYRVCAGKLDTKKHSGCLTPTGVFKLGNDIAVYKEGMTGTFKKEEKEMVSVFGKRWIPLEREIANCTESCKGLGFQGVPWMRQSDKQEYVENRECIGHYESGGCIRLLTEDIEELFAVVVSKPCYAHIVKDFKEAKLPGVEKKF